MPTQIVPTYEDGDVRYDFALDNKAEVDAAMERFRDLVKNQKRTAYSLGQNGTGASLVRSFEESLTHDTVIFAPQRQGG